MSQVDVAPEVDAFLKKTNAAVIACVRPDGFPMSVATWYDWEGGRILVNMDARRSRLAWMRHNPKVSLTVLDHDWYRHVSLYGEVVSMGEDKDLADIDRLSRRYTGRPYRNRRAQRVSAWIEPHGFHVWELG